MLQQDALYRTETDVECMHTLTLQLVAGAPPAGAGLAARRAQGRRNPRLIEAPENTDCRAKRIALAPQFDVLPLWVCGDASQGDQLRPHRRP